jgi:hypothetical protein
MFELINQNIQIQYVNIELRNDDLTVLLKEELQFYAKMFISYFLGM